MYINAAPLNTFTNGLTVKQQEVQEIEVMNYQSLTMCIVELGDLGMIDEAQDLMVGMNPPDVNMWC